MGLLFFSSSVLLPESMTILKDGSSQRYTDPEAANGVILIQTKRGMVGKPVIIWNSSYGIQQNPKKMEMMNIMELTRGQQSLQSIAIFESKFNSPLNVRNR